nr:hypothetical protein [uncultured Dyadobacter sp.]
MKYFFCKTVSLLLGVVAMSGTAETLGQCLEKISPSTNQKVHYHKVPLVGKKEYLTFSKTGDELIFSYHNDEFPLVYHVLMFTEIRFFSNNGTFSLYTTTADRSNWQKAFVLSSPLTQKDLEKMKDIVKIQVLLTDETRVFSLDKKKNEVLVKAIACMH